MRRCLRVLGLIGLYESGLTSFFVKVTDEDKQIDHLINFLVAGRNAMRVTFVVIGLGICHNTRISEAVTAIVTGLILLTSS